MYYVFMCVYMHYICVCLLQGKMVSCHVRFPSEFVISVLLYCPCIIFVILLRLSLDLTTNVRRGGGVSGLFHFPVF